MCDEQTQLYLNALCERRDDCKPVDFISVTFADGSSPSVAQCHANVDRWVKENQTHIAIRGWLFLSSNGFNCCIAAHSIVKMHDGTLIDITPADPAVTGTRPPFQAHEGTEDEFTRFRVPRFSNLIWPLLLRG